MNTPKKSSVRTKPATPAAVTQLSPSQDSLPPDSPGSAFPVDSPEVARRGPGRPPKLCPTCNLPASECKGHEVPKFQLSEAAVKGLLQLIGNGAALVFSMSSGVALAELAPIWQFSDGESALMVPASAEYINELAPQWMLQYEKEFKIAFAVLPILIAKLTITNALIRVKKLELAKSQPPKSTPSAAAAKPEEPPVPLRAAAA